MSFNVRIYFENSSVGFPPQRPRSCGGCHSFLLCLKDLPTPLTDPVLGFMLGKQVLTPSLGSEGKVRGVHTCVCVFTCAHVCMWMCVHMHMCVRTQQEHGSLRTTKWILMRHRTLPELWSCVSQPPRSMRGICPLLQATQFMAFVL